MSTTKRDKTRQQKEARLASPGEAPELTAPQLNAVDALIAGATDAEAAQAASVVRATVNVWKRHNPAFMAAMNARREELWSSSRERLRSLLPAALDRLESEIADPDSAGGLRAALKLIETIPEVPIGPTAAGDILDGVAKARRGPGEDEQLEALINPTTAGPVTDAERRDALEELRLFGAFE